MTQMHFKKPVTIITFINRSHYKSLDCFYGCLCLSCLLLRGSLDDNPALGLNIAARLSGIRLTTP